MRTQQQINTARWEAAQEAAAAAEAAAIGGRAGDEGVEPSQRPVIEGGEGVAEGFELAEQELIDAAQHTDLRLDPLRDAFPVEAGGYDLAVYGEGDHEQSSELKDGDR